ncbi:MAG: glycosyltransferase [Sphaerobacter sp.]|nr:glycosyltransferase [Sphaerobacter sp.]
MAWARAGVGAAWAAVVVNRDAAVFLDGCLRALFDGDRPPAEVVVIDLGSSDDSLTELAGWPRVIVETVEAGQGLPGAANRGLEVTEAPLVVVLAPEVVVEPGFGAALVELFDTQPALGAAAGKVVAPDGATLLSAGGVVEEPSLLARERGRGEPVAAGWETPAEVAYAPAALMALRRRAVAEVGGFDPAFESGDYADVDLCHRLRAAGWRVRYEPALRATGLAADGLAAPGTLEDWHRGRLRYAVKHLRGEDWWGRFVPAEIARLRGLLAASVPADWPASSGVAAAETLARAGADAPARPLGILDGTPLVAYGQALDTLRAAAAALAAPGRPRSRWRGASRERSQPERAFAEAVVAAFEAQDRVNREVIAGLLLAFLGLAARPPGRAGEPPHR